MTAITGMPIAGTMAAATGTTTSRCTGRHTSRDISKVTTAVDTAVAADGGGDGRKAVVSTWYLVLSKPKFKSDERVLSPGRKEKWRDKRNAPPAIFYCHNYHYCQKCQKLTEPVSQFWHFWQFWHLWQFFSVSTRLHQRPACGRRTNLPGSATPFRYTQAKTIQIEIDHGRRVESKRLAHNQSSNDSNTQRPAQLRSHACADRERQSAEKSGHGSHHDGTEAQQACLEDCVFGRFVFFALGIEGKINHQDGVLLHNANQENDSYERDNIKVYSRYQ